MMDFSLLPKQTTESEIIEACRVTKEYHFAAFYVSSSFWIPLVAQELSGYNDIEIGLGVAFPFGSASPKVKACEIEEALTNGATTVDMVLNIGALKSGKYEVNREELRHLVQLCKNRAVTKCIIEVCYLTNEEIKIACDLITEAEVKFAKTSTGQFEGPSMQQFLLMKKSLIGTQTKLKVAGVKFPRPQNAIAFVKAGAERIGTRSAAEIVDSWDMLVEAGLIDPS